MSPAALLLVFILLGAAAEPARPKPLRVERRPSEEAVRQFKKRSGLTFAPCADKACLLEHEEGGCRPAHLASAHEDKDGTRVLVDVLVHPPLPGDFKHPRDTGCAVTGFTYFTRDCRLTRDLCPEVDFLPGSEEPGCMVWPFETLKPCAGSPVSPAQRRANLARAERAEEDQLRVLATPTLVGVRGGTWSGFEYSRALPCLAQEAAVTPSPACVDAGVSLFAVLEEGDACRVDADCSVLRGPVSAGACCVAVGSPARQKLETGGWLQRLQSTCGSADSHCPSCSTARCVEGRCRIAPDDIRIVWLNRCGFP
jgi:hypothetical protein